MSARGRVRVRVRVGVGVTVTVTVTVTVGVLLTCTEVIDQHTDRLVNDHREWHLFRIRVKARIRDTGVVDEAE